MFDSFQSRRLHNDLRAYEFSWGDLFDFSFQSWGLTNNPCGQVSSWVICLTFLFQSWGLHGGLRGYVFLGVICLAFLSGPGGWTTTCVDMSLWGDLSGFSFSVLGVEQQPAWKCILLGDLFDFSSGPGG